MREANQLTESFNECVHMSLCQVFKSTNVTLVMTSYRKHGCNGRSTSQFMKDIAQRAKEFGPFHEDKYSGLTLAYCIVLIVLAYLICWCACMCVGAHATV